MYNICSFYDDVFDEMQELLHYTLQELGFPSQISHHYIFNNMTNIIFGVPVLGEAGRNVFPKDTIIFNLEQLDPENYRPAIRQWTDNILTLGKYFTIWDYNQQNIDLLTQHGVCAKRFDFGYQKNLHRIQAQAQQDIDVLFYGSINYRRQQIIDTLKAQGVNVMPVFGVYGKERDQLIARSKLVLNLHQLDTELFEIVRCSYMMNNGIPIVSEVNPTTNIDSHFVQGIAASPYDQLVETCLDLLQDDFKRQKLGYKALEIISQRPQFLLLKDIL